MHIVRRTVERRGTISAQQWQNSTEEATIPREEVWELSWDQRYAKSIKDDIEQKDLHRSRSSVLSVWSFPQVLWRKNCDGCWCKCLEKCLCHPEWATVWGTMLPRMGKIHLWVWKLFASTFTWMVYHWQILLRKLLKWGSRWQTCCVVEVFSYTNGCQMNQMSWRPSQSKIDLHDSSNWVKMSYQHTALWASFGMLRKICPSLLDSKIIQVQQGGRCWAKHFLFGICGDSSHSQSDVKSSCRI